MKFKVKINYIRENPSSAWRGFAIVNFGAFSVPGWSIFDGPDGPWAKQPTSDSGKTDQNGKKVYYDNIRFPNESNDEGKYYNAFLEEIKKEICKAYRAEMKRRSPKQKVEVDDEDLPW